MSEDANKALVRRLYDEVWARGNLDVADQVFAEDYERHDLRAGDPAPGPEGQKQIAAAFRAAEDDGLAPAFVEQDHPLTLDGGAVVSAELVEG